MLCINTVDVRNCGSVYPVKPITAPPALTTLVQLLLQDEAELEEDHVPPKQNSKPKKQNKKKRQKERRRVGEGGHDRMRRAPGD
jgi:hypothetical protein